MNHSFRYTIIATTAVFALSGFAAKAAPAAVDAPAATAPRAQSPGMHQATIEQRIKDLHTKLLITSTQQPQWDAFADVMRNNARNMDHTFRQRVNTMSDMTAPENLQSYGQVAMSHAQDIQKLAPAFQALYDAMSSGQKKTADQVFRDKGNRGRHARVG